MMGGGPKKDKKFINKILNQIKNGKKEIFVVNDKMGTPTYTYDFAKNLDLLLNKELWGLYNLVCKGITSRMEVAKKIITLLNLEKEISIKSVSSDYFSKDYFAPRPLSERLLTKKLDFRNLNIMRHWEDALKDYLERSYSNFKNKLGY